MNKIKQLLEHFSSEEQEVLKEEYASILKEKKSKYIAQSKLYQKAYKMKKSEKVNKIHEEKVNIPENYLEYNNYRIVFEEVKGSLFHGNINECIESKYGYLITKVLSDNEIDIYNCDKVISIMGVK